MTPLDLSIVIPCATDLRIVDCLANIHETQPAELEIVVALNGPTAAVREALRPYKDIVIVELPERHLSRAYNLGIEAATHANVLLMDSDCLFEAGAIAQLYAGLRTNRVVKGRVLFQGRNPWQRMIANVREFTTSDFINAYSPPLAFSKSIIDDIGHYYFHESVPWSEDVDFDRRVRRAGIAIRYEPTATIHHSPLTVKQDLRSGWRYGIGRRVQESLGLRPPRRWLSWPNQIGRFKKTWKVGWTKGWLAAGYYLFGWRPANMFGYLHELWYERRTRPKAHINVVAALMTADGRLVMQHRDNRPGLRGANKWTLFGGRALDGETPKQAMQREIFEELGIKTELRLVMCVREPGNPRPYLQHIFFGLLLNPVSSLVVNEGQGAAAFSWAELQSVDTVPWFWQIYGETLRQLFHVES